MDRVAVFPSRWGWMALRWRDDALRRLVLGYATAEAAREATESIGLANRDLRGAMKRLVARLSDYADGAVDDFSDVVLDLADPTPFQRSVLAACRCIPYGQVLSYGQLAFRAGFPQAARAAGSVMARNPVPLIVPCHRVIGANGALGGFSAPSGVVLKRQLLTLEGALPVDPPAIGNTRRCRVRNAANCC